MSPERRKALKRGSGCRSKCDVAQYGIAGQLSEMQADGCAKECAFEVGLSAERLSVPESRLTVVESVELERSSAESLSEPLAQERSTPAVPARDQLRLAAESCPRAEAYSAKTPSDVKDAVGA